MIEGGTASATITGDGRMDLRLAGDPLVAVSCKLDTVTEVDMDGTALASAGMSHSIAISTSATLAFGNISASAHTDVAVETVIAATAPSILPGTSAQVQTEFAVFQADGTIAPEGASGMQVSVVNGTGKLTPTVSAWPWCSATGSGIANCVVGGQARAGAFLDFDFTFGTTAVAKFVTESSNSIEFGVGAGASVILSKHATVHGDLVAVADGFPKVTAATATTLRVTVRIPRPSASAPANGEDRIRYDPVLKASGGGSAAATFFHGHNSRIKINGAGTVIILPTPQHGTSAKGAISLRIGSIAEVDASGNALTTVSGTLKTFPISATATGTFGMGPVRGDVSLGVQASSMDISSTLWSTATISQKIVVFSTAGTVHPEGSGGYSMAVNNGTVKSSISISNWPYCGSGGAALRTCSAEGAFLDITFSIKTRSSVSVASDSTMSRTFDVGGGAKIVFSKRVMVEGEWTVMASDFPKLLETATTSSDATVVIRIPKPANPAARVLYDPCMDDGDNPPSSASIHKPFAAGLAIALVAAAAAALR